MPDLVQGHRIQVCVCCMGEGPARQLAQTVEGLATASYFGSLTTSPPSKKEKLSSGSVWISPKKEGEHNSRQKFALAGTNVPRWVSQKENLDVRCRSHPTAAPGLLVVVIWPNLCFAKSVGPKSVCSDLAGFLASVLTERLLLHPMTKYLRAQIELNIYWIEV